MSQLIQSSFIGQRTANGEAPAKGPRVLALPLDFSIQASYNINLSHAQESDRLEFIQGAFVDNSQNPNPLTIQSVLTGQLVTWPAFSMGWAAMFCPNQPELVIATAFAGVVNICLTTFPVANEIISAGATIVQSAGSTGHDVSSNSPALLANLIETVAANPARNNIEVQNQDATQVQAVLDNGTGGQQSIILLGTGGANLPGGDWSSQTFKGRLRLYSSVVAPQVMIHWD